MFGLKKVYSSPKTNVIPSQPASIVTSPFMDCNEINPKQVIKVEFLA